MDEEVLLKLSRCPDSELFESSRAVLAWSLCSPLSSPPSTTSITSNSSLSTRIKMVTVRSTSLPSLLQNFGLITLPFSILSALDDWSSVPAEGQSVGIQEASPNRRDKSSSFLS